MQYFLVASDAMFLHADKETSYQIKLRSFVLFGASGSTTKTCLYKYDPLKPHLYSKTGVYKGIDYFSYFCSKTKMMGTRSNRLDDAVLTSTHNLCFEQKYEKYQNFLSQNFSFFGGENFNIFE